jgi:hypothetical protein
VPPEFYFWFLGELYKSHNYPNIQAGHTNNPQSEEVPTLPENGVFAKASGMAIHNSGFIMSGV